jgi:prepilin signal peptidase PulO-like enzyme (type II secretory pathway)
MLEFIIVALIGWVAGGLVNYLSDVLPERRKIVNPFCLVCESQLLYWNYFFWPRRCDKCGERRSIRTWIVELVYIVITVWLWSSPPEHLGIIVGLILLIYFGVVVVIDLEHRLILHPVSLVGGVIGLIVGVWLHGLPETILGGLAGFGIMLGLYLLGYLLARGVARIKNQTLDEEALGFGDVMLGGVLGLLLGWPGIVLGIVLAVLIGGLVSLLYVVILLVRRRYRSFIAIPYGPFLVAGCVGLLYFRDLIMANLIN